MTVFDAEVEITLLKQVEEQAVRTAAALERVLDLMRQTRGMDKEERSDDGIWLGVSVAYFHKCNIQIASHRDFKRDPASPKGSRFCIAIRSAEVRQAQDGRQMCYSVVIVSYKKIKGFFLGL